MEFKKLLEMYKAGVSKVKHNADGSFTFAYNKSSPITLGKSDAEKLLQSLGWTKMSTSVEKACSHMGGIISKINSCRKDEVHFDVTFEHSCIADSTKNVWRTKIEFKNRRKFTIIEGITGLGGKYSVMSSIDSFSKSKGFSKMEDALNYVFDNVRDTSMLELMSDEELKEIISSNINSDNVKDAISIMHKRKKNIDTETNKVNRKEENEIAKKKLEEDLKEVKDITADLY